MNKGILTLASLGLLLAASLHLTAADGDAKKGEAVFQNCAPCHNSDSDETKVGPGLKNLFKRDKLVNGKPVTDENVIALIASGSGSMPPFGDSLSADDKNNVVAYLKTLPSAGGAPAAGAAPAGAAPAAAAGGDAKKGQVAFESCAPCHNTDSTDVKVGPGLKGLFTRDKLVNGKPVNAANVKALITDGSGAMPPFGDAISSDDKDNIIAYLMTL
jgi:cytochrome c2